MIAEKTGSGCNCGVAGTTTSDRDSEMVDTEDARIRVRDLEILDKHGLGGNEHQEKWEDHQEWDR